MEVWSDKTPQTHTHTHSSPLRVQLINRRSDHCVALIPALPPQVVLINAVRDVAKALAELIGATKCAAGKAADDPSMYQLKSAAKVKAEKNKTPLWEESASTSLSSSLLVILL